MILLKKNNMIKPYFHYNNHLISEMKIGKRKLIQQNIVLQSKIMRLKIGLKIFIIPPIDLLAK